MTSFYPQEPASPTSLLTGAARHVLSPQQMIHAGTYAINDASDYDCQSTCRDHIQKHPQSLPLEVA